MSLKLAGSVTTIILVVTLSAAQGADQEGVILDPQTEDYIIMYKSGYSGQLEKIVFVPSTKIEPRLKSKFGRKSDKDTIFYRYKLRNESGSKQNIDMLLTKVSRIDPDGQLSPPEWDGIVVTDIDSSKLRLAWNFRGDEFLGGLAPGKSLGGFALASVDLPGIAIVQITGAAPVTEWLSHYPPGDVGDQVDEIKKSNFVPRHAAVPTIFVPDPFDAAAVLTSLQAHIKDDWVAMKLVDPAFAARLDEGFEAAIETAKRGNTEGLRRELKALRHLRKGFGEPEEQEHAAGKNEDDDTPENQVNTKAWPHPIAKLAARVLKFDLKYLESHVKGRLE